MASIDGLIGAMAQRGAQGITLESGQPSRLFSAGGVADGAVLDEPQLQAMLSEIVPPSLYTLLQQDGQFNFPYAAPSGPVNVLVERQGLATRASITPAVLPPSAAPAPPVEWNPGAAAQAPQPAQAPPAYPQSYAPPAYGAPQYGAPPAYGAPPQVPMGSPIPQAYGGPPGAPMASRPSVGCLPALGLAVVCVFAINVLGRILGVGPIYGIVLLSAIAVLIDAQNLRVRSGKLQGLADMGPWGWFFACLLLWGFGMPYYLLARPLYAQIKDAEDSGGTPYSQ